MKEFSPVKFYTIVLLTKTPFQSVQETQELT